MKYRRFGRTELEMPVFSCGGMRYQYGWNDVALEEVPREQQENLEATIRRSLEVGINHIETARGYGTSEMQLGQILPTLPRDEMIVQTKVHPVADVGEFEKTFEKSMGYLKLDYVDLFSLHGINNEEVLEHSMGPGGCFEKAVEFQKAGRCRFMGFSTHGNCELIEKVIETGVFDYVNLHWYFVNDFNWGAVKAARERDMGVFIISPNDKGGLLYKPSERLMELCQPFTPMQFNDLYCLSREEVHTLSLGAARPSDFDEHVAVLEYYDDLPGVVKEVEARLRRGLAERLGEAWMAGWWRGIPEWEELPGELNVQEMLRLYTYVEGLDMVEYGKMRYNLLGNGGHWFGGQNLKKGFDGEVEEGVVRILGERGNEFAKEVPGCLRRLHEKVAGEEKKRLSESGK